ncbi:uncharacterized protein LOC116853350 [Odontomachus brunneus]|uniref:uncharacterized protein LOC116853350 n=1 Tax=Odontomachus brunneus TaxID=486640 RepID=UPI0013F1BDF2|nr:uncharacterized protein LOC116853350 [Odontomachus brunneus]
MSHKKYAILNYGGRGKRMFAFPNPMKDRRRYLKWIAASGNPTLITIPYNKIVKRTVCEDHFEENFKLRTRLSAYAVPTLLLPDPIDIEEEMITTNTSEGIGTTLSENSNKGQRSIGCNDCYEEIRKEEMENRLIVTNKGKLNGKDLSRSEEEMEMTTSEYDEKNTLEKIRNKGKEKGKIFSVIFL